MSDIFKLLTEALREFGMVQTLIMLAISLIVFYSLNKFSQNSKVQTEKLVEVIKENRNMSEIQLATLNTLVGKITTMVEFTQVLVGHILEKDGDGT